MFLNAKFSEINCGKPEAFYGSVSNVNKEGVVNATLDAINGTNFMSMVSYTCPKGSNPRGKHFVRYCQKSGILSASDMYCKCETIALTMIFVKTDYKCFSKKMSKCNNFKWKSKK